jgi:hypothetical protein
MLEKVGENGILLRMCKDWSLLELILSVLCQEKEDNKGLDVIFCLLIKNDNSRLSPC